MPFVERVLNQRRASRLYEANSLPTLLRSSPLKATSPGKKQDDPAWTYGAISPAKLHTNKPSNNSSSGGSSKYSASSTNNSTSSSAASIGSATSVGATSAGITRAKSSVGFTQAPDSPPDEKFYFPYDVQTKIVLPVMPPNVTLEFALTAIGQWLENFKGIVRKRNANNVLSEYCMKLLAGDGPQPHPCPESNKLHTRSKVKFNSGSSKFQTTGIGYYYQFCKSMTSKGVFHYRIMTPLLNTEAIANDPWLSASLEYRTRLAPKKRLPRVPKQDQKKQGERLEHILSPEVLPPPILTPKRDSQRERTLSPEILSPSPIPTPTANRILPPLRRTSPIFILSPSGRNILPTAANSTRSTSYTPDRYRFPHMNASPASQPTDASESSSCDSDAELLSFSTSGYCQEIRRRNQANLPLPSTSADVDIPIRFYLPDAVVDTTLRVNKMGRVCLKKDEESIALDGFPLAHCTSIIWLLEPHTEADPIWRKINWREVISIDGAFSLTFMIEKDEN